MGGSNPQLDLVKRDHAMPDLPADAPPDPTSRTRRRFGWPASATGPRRAAVLRWTGAPGSPRRIVGLVLLVSLLLGLLAAAGIGETSAAQPALDGGAWLASANGSLVHANGVSARIDWTTSVSGGTSRVIQNRTGGFIDQGNGRFLSIDGAAMKVSNTTEIDGNDIEIESGGSHSFVVYKSDGVIQEIDPTTLDAIGDAVDLGGPVGSAGVDAQGTLYAALNDSRQIAVVKRNRLESLIGDGSDAGAQLVTVGTAVTALDTAAGVVLLLHNGEVTDSIDLGLPQGTELKAPPLESGSTLWLTDVTHRQLIGIGMDGNRAQTVDIPSSTTPSEPQPAGDQVYLYDKATAALATIDTTTGSARTQKLAGLTTKTEFFGKDGLVYVNDLGGPSAFVANDRGVVSPLVKYATNKPLPPPVISAKPQPPVKKLTPKVKKKPARKAPRVLKIHPRPKPRPKPKPNPRPKPKPTTTTTSTTTDPNSTTTTTVSRDRSRSANRSAATIASSPSDVPS